MADSTIVFLIVSEAAEQASGDYFGFFDFTLAGVPLVAGVVATVVLFGDRLLPDRTSGVVIVPPAVAVGAGGMRKAGQARAGSTPDSSATARLAALPRGITSASDTMARLVASTCWARSASVSA